MSQTTPTETNVLPICSQLVAGEMRRMERTLRNELASNVPIIDEMVVHGGATRGKRFRPLLMMLTARANGEVTENHITLATSLEMIHAATLVHDDILDGALTRRHRRTINARWGNHGAVLFGDYLFTHAFYLASTTGDAFACQQIGRTTNQVCEGELQQSDAAGNYETTIDEYFEIIGKKTAALCACSCFLGAHYAGADQLTCQRWEDVGRRLGLAFQIIDDVLDVRGNASDCGKTLGTDLQTAKPTLPVLLALQRETPSERMLWIDRLSQCDVPREEVNDWMSQLGATEAAFAQAEQFVSESIESAQEFNAQFSDAFAELGEFLLSRTH